MKREKRKSPRTPYQVPVSIQYKDSFWHAKTRDISPGGIFILSRNFPKVGSEVQLTLSLPGIIMASIKGYVRWVSSGMGFGVQFVPIGPKETHAINSIDGSAIDL